MVVDMWRWRMRNLSCIGNIRLTCCHKGRLLTWRQISIFNILYWHFFQRLKFYMRTWLVHWGVSTSNSQMLMRSSNVSIFNINFNALILLNTSIYRCSPDRATCPIIIMTVSSNCVQNWRTLIVVMIDST